MVKDVDAPVRRKAAELLADVACSMGVEHMDKVNTIISNLITMNLDRNSFVRHEAAISLSEIGASMPSVVDQILKKLLVKSTL